MSTSIAVHGGVSQLLELLKAAVQQVSCLVTTALMLDWLRTMTFCTQASRCKNIWS